MARRSILTLCVLGGLAGAGAILDAHVPARASSARADKVKLHIIATAEGEGEIDECG